MFGLDLFRRFPVMVLANMPDAAGGGGLAPSGAAPVTEAPTAQDGSSHESAAAPATNDDEGDELEVLLGDDDADDQPTGPVDPQRFARIRSAHNKLKRRFGKAAPTLRALRQAGVQDVAELLSKARQYDEFSQVIQSNPQVRRALYDLEGASEPKPAPAADADEKFDRSKLPFPVSDDDPLSVFMATLAEQVHDLKRENGRLRQTVTTDLTGRRQAAEVRERDSWNTAVTAAEQELPAPFRKVFRDAMVTAFRERHRHRQPVDKIIEHYLSDARKAGAVSKRQEQIAAAASREQGAAANRTNWPKHVTGGGSPAPANRAANRLSDVNKRVRQFGG